jgi:signal transduction histidine kinase
MDYKSDQITDLKTEDGGKVYHDILKISDYTATNKTVQEAIVSLLKFLKECFGARESWVLEQSQGIQLLWNLDHFSIKEEITSESLLLVKDKPYGLVLENNFLVDKYHLIFPFSLENEDYAVGLSSSSIFELDNYHSSFLGAIQTRLKELFYLNSRDKYHSSNVDLLSLLNNIPQSIVFKEDGGSTWMNKPALKLFKPEIEGQNLSNKEFAILLKSLKDKVQNKEEVEMIGNNMLTTMGAFPSSFGEDWIWKFEKKVLKVVRKVVRIDETKGELWVFDNVSELYNANERLNSLFRTLNVAYDEINANLIEFQSKSSSKKSITDLEAEESRIIQQYDDNDILGKVTHDLRTPFAKVYTVVQLLLSDNQENLSEQQVERINLIKQIVADGLLIVKGFLSTDNMVLDDKKFHPEPVELQRFVRENLVPYELLSAKKNIIFITDAPNDELRVNVDKTYLKRIVDNLVSNAIKFSPFESQIVYKISLEGERVIFSIKDNGPGLTNDDKTRLFKKYQQLSAKPIGTDDSTGLGLYIVKTMVDKLGGDIWVESTHGSGANFKVAFPIYNY